MCFFLLALQRKLDSHFLRKHGVVTHWNRLLCLRRKAPRLLFLVERRVFNNSTVVPSVDSQPTSPLLILRSRYPIQPIAFSAIYNLTSSLDNTPEEQHLGSPRFVCAAFELPRYLLTHLSYSLTNSVQGITWRLGFGVTDPAQPEG